MRVFCRFLIFFSQLPLQTWITLSWRPSSLHRQGGRAAEWALSRRPSSPASGRPSGCGLGRACWLRVAGSPAWGVSPGGWISPPLPARGTKQSTVVQWRWWSWNWAKRHRWDSLFLFQTKEKLQEKLAGMSRIPGDSWFQKHDHFNDICHPVGSWLPLLAPPPTLHFFTFKGEFFLTWWSGPGIL